MKFKGILLVLSSSLMAISAGIRPFMGLAEGEKDASSMPKGWQAFSYNEDGEEVTSPYLKASAYKDKKKGRSLLLYRRISAYTLACSSQAFEASKNTSYKLTFFYRSDCLHDEENKISASITEIKEDGSKTSAEVVSAKGRQGVWKSFSGYYSTSNLCKNLVITFSSYGYGDFYINDVSLKGKPAPKTFFNDFALEDGAEDMVALKPFSSSLLSDEAHTGERSLKITNQGVKTHFGNLPVGEYELKFRYKHDYQDASRLSIRIDNTDYANEAVRKFYADPVPADGTSGTWASYSYKFRKTTSDKPGYCDIYYLKIHSYGTFLIDDLEVVGADGFNYIIGGTFEGYNAEGINLYGNSGIAKQSDGSFVYGGCHDGVLTNGECSVMFDLSKLGLTHEETYTLKYEHRNGYSNAGIAFYGPNNNGTYTNLKSGTAGDNWTEEECSFVAQENKDIKIVFSAVSPMAGYLRNVAILDKESKNVMTLGVKEYTSTGGGEIESFPYGKFEYDFPPDPEDSSSSSEEESSSGETEESSSPSSETETPSSTENSENTNPPSQEGKKDGSNGLLVGLTSAFLAVGSLSLAASIIFLIRSRKHGK